MTIALPIGKFIIVTRNRKTLVWQRKTARKKQATVILNNSKVFKRKKTRNKTADGCPAKQPHQQVTLIKNY